MFLVRTDVQICCFNLYVFLFAVLESDSSQQKICCRLLSLSEKMKIRANESCNRSCCCSCCCSSGSCHYSDFLSRKRRRSLFFITWPELLVCQMRGKKSNHIQLKSGEQRDEKILDWDGAHERNYRSHSRVDSYRVVSLSTTTTPLFPIHTHKIVNKNVYAFSEWKSK